MEFIRVVGEGDISVDNSEEILSLRRGSYNILLLKISKLYALIFRNGNRFELIVDSSKTNLMEKVDEYKKIAKID